jgi:hypothetical protein
MSESTITMDLGDQPPLSEEHRDEARRVMEAGAADASDSSSGRTFFAVVNGDGTLARGGGAASATRLAPGNYQVLFRRDVNRGAFIATLGLSADAGASPPGEIIVNLRAGTTNGVFVETFNSTGAVEDRSFHLAVITS